MLREIVKIDRELCNGCGNCIPNCYEGALQMIDDKATLVSELMCDGLGACLGHCPVGAITIELREADAYDENIVMKEMIPLGKNVIIAHLLHLQEHNENAFLEQGLQYLQTHQNEYKFKINEIMEKLHHAPHVHSHSEEGEPHACGCAGSAPKSFEKPSTNVANADVEINSELTQWPIQLHLINPMAGYFKNADLLLAADCVAFSLGNFHPAYLKGRKLLIGCPKLDSGKESYVEKLTQLIDEAKINTLTVMIMEVPCCGGLVQLARLAVQNAKRKVPIKTIIVGIQGGILEEEWI